MDQKADDGQNWLPLGDVARNVALKAHIRQLRLEYLEDIAIEWLGQILSGDEPILYNSEIYELCKALDQLGRKLGEIQLNLGSFPVDYAEIAEINDDTKIRSPHELHEWRKQKTNTLSKPASNTPSNCLPTASNSVPTVCASNTPPKGEVCWKESPTLFQR